MTDSSLPVRAVEAALAQNWKEAIRINTTLLKEQKDNVEALSRLAYAYSKTGQISLSKRTYEKVLTLDEYNHIAQKNLKKLSTIKRKDAISTNDHHLSPLMFLEEPGKTKIVECIHVAPNQIVSSLSAGMEVIMKPKNHCIEIRTHQNIYLAALPDDISFKLTKLISAGNTYQVIIKNIEKNCLTILIRELSRGKRFLNQPSFTSTTSYIPFARGGTLSTQQDHTETHKTEHESDQNPEEQEES